MRATKISYVKHILSKFINAVMQPVHFVANNLPIFVKRIG